MQTLSLYYSAILRVVVTLLVVSISLILLSLSDSAVAGNSQHDWQLKRLLHPTVHQRESERAGQVFIYDGLSSKEIDKAMDKGFDRIGNMMFINRKDKPKRDLVPHDKSPVDDAADNGVYDEEDGYGGC